MVILVLHRVSARIASQPVVVPLLAWREAASSEEDRHITTGTHTAVHRGLLDPTDAERQVGRKATPVVKGSSVFCAGIAVAFDRCRIKPAVGGIGIVFEKINVSSLERLIAEDVMRIRDFARNILDPGR